MKTIKITMDELRADEARHRKVLSKLPGLLFISAMCYLFAVDPVWPFHALTHPWAKGIWGLLTDGYYRTWWLSNYGATFAVLGVTAAIILYAFKVAVWNRVFKTLLLRTNSTHELRERKLGRCYWVEGGAGYRMGCRMRARYWRLLQALHVRQIAIVMEGETSPDIRVRKLKYGVPVGETIKTPSPQPVPAPATMKKRTIYYKPSFFPLINIVAPHRSMHRLVGEIPADHIFVHDPYTLVVEGWDIERDMSKKYPTFLLTDEPQVYEPMDVVGIKKEFDAMVERGSWTVQRATEMDTLMHKQTRKYQEVNVSVDMEMLERYKDVRRQSVSQQ